MRRFKQYVLTGLGYIFLVVAFSFAQHGPSNADPSKDVIVDNTAANPVPTLAQGTTTSPASRCSPHHDEENGVLHGAVR